MQELENKQNYRDMIKERLQALSQPEWASKSEIITEHVLKSSHWQYATHIALYFSVQKEVNTHGLIERAWQEGKVIYLPKCLPKQKLLSFYRVDRWEQLGKPYFGIKEPIPEQCTLLKAEELELVIVPGLCFDREGFRIGYGGGYYDRFLAQLNRAIPRLSLSFQFQLFDHPLPREHTDQPVDRIITDEACHTVKNCNEA